METLRQLADKHGIMIGAACEPALIKTEQRYHDTLANEFNVLVAENCMKFMYIEPQRGQYDFTQADIIVAFARKNKQKVRGHTLVWHNQLPYWFTTGEFTRNEALDIMRNHIFATLEHFRGDIFCWDVVNEALSDEGGWREKSPWFKLIGPDYVDQAFRFAYEADPNIELFYNDYGMDMGGSKADECYNMLRGMLDRGIPVNGIGFQFHLGSENQLDYDQVVTNMRRFKDIGLNVHATEMDMGIKKPVTDILRQQQAIEYANRFKMGLDAGLKAMVLWGFTDKYTWVPDFTNGEYIEPLIFDTDYQPKPAYHAICELLSGAEVKIK